MSFYAYSALINFITCLGLSFIIFRKKQKIIVDRIFILFLLSIAFWSFFYFFWQITTDEWFALLFSRILMIGAIFIPIFFFHFVVLFLELQNENKIRIVLSYIFGGISFLFSFTTLFVKNVVSSDLVAFWPRPGMYFHLFLIVWFIIFIYTLVILIKAYRINDGIKKQQIRLISLAIIIGLIGGSTNYFLWYNINIKPVGNILISVYVLLIVYAIITKRFMDIKLALRQSSVYVMSLVVSLIPAVILRFVVRSYIPDFSFWADFVILIIAVSIFPVLRNFFYRFANKYFFTTLYDPKKLIGDLTNSLSATIDEKESYEILVDAMKHAFHCKAIGVLNYDLKDDVFILKYNTGFKMEIGDKVKISKRIFNDYIVKDNVVVVDELKSKDSIAFKQFITTATKLKIQVLAPMTLESKVIGAIILSEKESRDIYNNEDIETIDIIDSQMAISLENALLYSQTKQFNEKLTEEVERATAEVRQANVELKKLDKAKSEFISIASHQLRTPLTVIKGYASMMLDGSFGEIDPKIRENIKKIFDSNERLIGLVEDLLNVSRIESGRLKFDFEKCQLEDIIASVVEELTPNVQAQGLYIKFKQPTGLPAMLIDKRKIRQVIMNMIDNSVKYTKLGGINLELTQHGDVLHFCITDTGMGISPTDLPNLFKKFSRGEDTSIVHTEGTGLGLYVGKQMVEAHGGKIWAESEGNGKGSKFCFELPVNFTPPKEMPVVN
ncbi:MAG: ATP-binding protein [bacterium]